MFTEPNTPITSSTVITQGTATIVSPTFGTVVVTVTPNGHTIIRKYNPDQTLDTTFGNNGTVTNTAVEAGLFSINNLTGVIMVSEMGLPGQSITATYNAQGQLISLRQF